MNKFYRIQPRGLELPARSEGCEGCDKIGGICVFSSAWQIWYTEGDPKNYGDEVVEILTDETGYDVGDIEGLRISDGVITRRWSWTQYSKLFGYRSYLSARNSKIDDSIDEIPEEEDK